LIVDDSELERKILVKTLGADGYETSVAPDGETALRLMSEEAPDLVLLDVVMPGLSGHEVLGLIMADEALRMVPVIMVTSRTDANDVQEALDAGAFDYIRKPFEAVEIRARARAALRIRDYQERLRFLSTHDGLTGLLNHVESLNAADKAVQRAASDGSFLSIVMIDIDHFKGVNDTLGHQFGDAVLAKAGALLADCFAGIGATGRYGGEEFIVVLRNFSLDMAKKSADAFRRLVSAIAWPTAPGLRVTVSAGVAAFDAGRDADCAALIQAADVALYEAKSSGRDRVAG
jgi:diguanylate cyclase (GGDEF)-like protein